MHPPDESTPARTYRQGSERASWRWLLPGATETRPTLMRVLEALEPLGSPTTARVVTLDAGDEAWVGDISTEGGRREILAFVDRARHLRTVVIRFDADVCLPEGRDLLRGAGLIFLERVVSAAGDAIQSQLTLTLFTDLYDPDAASGANDAVARLNAPALGTFLQTIPRVLGARLEEIESRSAGAVGPRGYEFDDGAST